MPYELLYIIPLSMFILFMMIIIGVTIIGTLTGNTGMVEEMMMFFKLMDRPKKKGGPR